MADIFGLTFEDYEINRMLHPFFHLGDWQDAVLMSEAQKWRHSSEGTVIQRDGEWFSIPYRGQQQS